MNSLCSNNKSVRIHSHITNGAKTNKPQQKTRFLLLINISFPNCLVYPFQRSHLPSPSAARGTSFTPPAVLESDILRTAKSTSCNQSCKTNLHELRECISTLCFRFYWFGSDLLCGDGSMRAEPNSFVFRLLLQLTSKGYEGFL